MAHFSIISSQSGSAIWSGAPRYVGAYLKPGYLEFPAIGSPVAIAWHVGDYVVYPRTGKTYRLYRTPQAAEQGAANMYGASFLYENVQFFDDSKQLEFCPFTDLVPGDNTVHFSTQNTVSFFGKPLNVAERIQACLEAQYGAGSWEVRIVTTTDPDLLEVLATEIEFSVTGVNCLEVLDKVYDEWGGLGWIHSVENGKNIITIGASNVRTGANTTVPFSYGDGLVRVERSIANADQIGTRLFAYGSMKNMDATYYRGLDIYHADSVDIEHLMIPLSSWGTTSGKPDARKAYIENATAIASLGLIPRTAYFDGTGDLPDIHPTIERMTIGEVYDAGGAGYVPDLSKWSRADRIDEIVSATNPTDKGTSAEQGQRYAESIDSTLNAVSTSLTQGSIHQLIWSGTTTKRGRLTIKFGSNLQTFTMASGWTSPEFSNLHVEIVTPGGKKDIPLSVTAAVGNAWTIVLPESVSMNDVMAGQIEIYVGGYVFPGEGSYVGPWNYTFNTDPATPVNARVEYELTKTFSVRIPQIGFDIDDYADLGEGKTISMKTGMCAGRDFEIKDVVYVASADAWDLTLYRAVDEDLNIMFPNADYEIAAGDQFVLLDIAMPEMYVAVASARLLAAAQKLLADISVEQPFFSPQIDAKVVYNESRILREGMWMDVTHDGTQEYVIIDSITIDENGSNIPTYEVALRQKKGLDWTENIGKSSSSKNTRSVSGGEAMEANGTVTSVGLEVPTGLEVSGSPITSAGVLRVGLADGYKIPLISELAQYFEPGNPSSLIQLKPAYDYLGPRKGLVFGRSSSEDVNVDLEVVNIAGAGEEPVYALHSKLPFYSDSFVSAGGISDGPGSTGIDLAAMWASLQNLDSVHTYDSYLIASAHIPDMSSVYGYLKQADIDPILALIPAQASATNQLADKAFVNSSIATATSTYRGNYNEYSDLNLNPSATHAQVATKLGTVISEADANDYCFVEIPTSASTPTQIERTERYKYNGTGWEYEYTLNNSGFTAVQWAAINSNITADKVSAYDTLVGYFSNGVLEDTHLPAMYIGDAPVKFSAQTAQDVGGLGNLTMANAKYLRGYGRDGSTIYNLIGISQGTVSSRPVDLLIIGSTAQASETDPYLARTYLRGSELYLQTGDGVNSSALVLSATQNATFYGAVYIQNNRSIWWKNKPAEGANEISISLMALTSSNVFALGSGLIATGNNARAYGTYLYGASLSFYTGTATTGAVRRWMINSSGNLYPYADKSYNLGAAANYIKEAYIGKMFLAPGVYLEVDSNGYVHLSGEGFYCDGFVSAGGLSSGGGSAGVDLAAVWGSLIENAGEGYGKRIHTAHLPDVTITGQNVTGSASYSGTGGASSALTLTINVPTAVTSLGGKTGDITLGPGLSIDSNKVLSNSGVRSVSVSGDYLRVNTGGTNADLTVPYANTVKRFKRYEGTAENEGYDLNTLLSGGGITSQYTSVYYWANAPANMSYGGAVQVNADANNSLAMQFAWDVVHEQTQGVYETGKLWWRDATYHDGAADWGEWHLIYDDANLTASAVVGILGTTPVNRATADGSGNIISSTYLKLSGGTMSGNITIPNGNAILAASSNSMLAVNSLGTTFYCGPGYEISSAFLLCSGNINLVHRKYTAASTYNDYAIWDSSNATISNAALTLGSASLGTSSAPIGYATQAKRPFAVTPTQAAGAIDLNTILAGGGATRNVYNSSYWAHAPAGATYFGMAWQLNPTSVEAGSMQFFWDGDYNSTTAPTGRLFWRLHNSTGWADDWHRIYDSANANLSTIDWDCKDLNAAGKVNVGAPSSTPAAVNVAGTIWASTGIWSDGYVSAGRVASSSDERLKANIKDFGYSAELLMSLKPREWDWNGKTPMIGHSAGFVAQEVEPHLPYAVTERTYKQLTYDIFHALEVSALQDHDTRIKALEDENRKKDAKIAALEKEIKQLRAL